LITVKIYDNNFLRV